jgi:uncharacterized protein (DUF433 family)
MSPKTQTVQTIPLTVTDEGAIRIADTRISLESVIHHFNLGATAEHIVHKFPALNLADAYAVIAYYLANRQIVDDYIKRQDAKAGVIRKKLEEDSEHMAWIADLRQRLMERNREAV